MWMKGEFTQRVVGRSRLLRRLSVGTLARLELFIMSGHKSPATLATLRRCRRESESLLTGNEAFLLHSLARAQSRLDAAFAEVGVYEGSSARVLCEAKGSRPLYLFDTFAGLPEPGRREARVLAPGQFSAPLERVKALLAPFPKVHFCPGTFPDSAEGLTLPAFSLVHLDVDLRESTLAALEYFYQRMVPGGVILSHDYSILPGVADAFDGFLRDKTERLIELPTTQAMIIRDSQAQINALIGTDAVGVA
jgi:O-methyltransferase